MEADKTKQPFKGQPVAFTYAGIVTAGQRCGWESGGGKKKGEEKEKQ